MTFDSPSQSIQLAQLLTRKAAASILSIHLRTLDRLLAEGKLPYVKKSRKMVRIRTKDILAFIGE